MSAPTGQASYTRWRSAAFTSSWLLYAGYYLCRENLRSVRTLPGSPQAQNDLTGLLFNFSLAYVIGHVVSGSLSDLRSARKVALVGGLISAACTASMLWTHSTPALLALDLLNGFAQGFGFPALARMLAVWFRQQERPGVLAWWSASYSVGGVLAGSLTLWFATTQLFMPSWGWKRCFLFPPLLLILISIWFYVTTRDEPEDVGLTPVEPGDRKPRRSLWSGWWTVLSNSHIRTIAAMYFFLKMTRYALLFWLPLYLVQTTQLAPSRASSTAALFEFFGFVGAVFAVRASARWFQSRRYPVAAILLFGLGFLALIQPIVSTFGWWASAVSIAAMGLLVYAVDALMVSVAVLESVPLDCSARAIAAVNGAGSVGQMLSPLLVTWFALHYGWDNLFNLFLMTSLAAAAIVAPRWNDDSRDLPASAPAEA
ncbi:MFS transporter [Acidicapsa dinghuensis]|uniref:MFS transporter n=1 Tax=Acidicapsa dinghuensis TaxID=2218256 RepID=A0ABW1ELP7_9BACT|nr:MFS transporter [Acidicapsa dinghuensis]